MATSVAWRDWVQTQDIYSPDFDNGKAIGDALKDFESSLLGEDTSVWTLRASQPTRRARSGRINYSQLATICRENVHDRPSYRFFFIHRFLLKGLSEPEPDDAHRLQLSPEALRLLASTYCMPPSFLLALSRYYLPHGRGFRRYEDADGILFWNQWYFLPFRVQVPCTDEEGGHEGSTIGSNQMNPFHYLHLHDEKVDIRGSHIAVCLCHNGRDNSTMVAIFNLMHGRWPKIVEEPQHRLLEALEHPNVPFDPMFVHLVLITTIVRWWNNALHSVNEQLIAYERRLQEDGDDQAGTNVFHNATSKALHAMAAHVQRYGAELDSLEDTASELARVFSTTHGQDSGSLTGIEHMKSQLKMTNDFVREQEKKIQNLLALVRAAWLSAGLLCD